MTDWDLDEVIQGIDQTIRKLAIEPTKGTDLNFVRQGCRQYHDKCHVIVYRETTTSLDISRILHKRMDIAQHTIQ
jgi:plasmid stabilization system protein ParE